MSYSERQRARILQASIADIHAHPMARAMDSFWNAVFDYEPEAPEIECPQCDGEGVIWNNADRTSGMSVPCPDCNGEGWRKMTDQEWTDASEKADEERSSAPIDWQAQREAAWRLK